MKKLLLTSLVVLGFAAPHGYAADAPIQIEAENYDNMQGVQTETTTDTGGGKNVGYIDANDWMTYKVDLPCDGKYLAEFRVAAQNAGGKFQFDKAGGGAVYGNFVVPQTNGYQTWTTISQEITLAKGPQGVGIGAQTGDWNINWFRLTPLCSSIPPVDENIAAWLLDGTKSKFYFVTTKRNTAGADIAEAQQFTQMAGSVSPSGKIVFSIPLISVNTNNTIRDDRIRLNLFEANMLPKLNFASAIDPKVISDLAVGGFATQTVTGNLTLHGVVKSITLDLRIIKHSADEISVAPVKPIVINAVDFDLSAGVEALRAVMGLTGIGEGVPAYFNAVLNNNPTKQGVYAINPAPEAPTQFVGILNSAAQAELSWADNSTSETGFIVRRKGPDGRWATVNKTLANITSLIDTSVPAGSSDYKVFSFFDSTPSPQVTGVNVVNTTGTSSSNVSQGSAGSTGSTGPTTSSSGTTSSIGNPTVGASYLAAGGKCAGCHQDQNGDGIFGDGVIKFDVNKFTYFSLPKYAGKGYTDTKESLAQFIADNMSAYVSDVANCANNSCRDIAEFLYSQRGKTVVVDPSSCSVNDPVLYGERSVKLLTTYEYGNSLKALFTKALPKDYGSNAVTLPDTITDGLPNHVTVKVTEARYTNYSDNAREIAQWALQNNALPFTCTTKTSAACAQSFIDNFATLVFRRPLTTDEVTQYTAIITADDTGLEWAIRGALTSPQFLYRSELGMTVAEARTKPWGNTAVYAQADQAAYVLDPYEYASFLAFTYTGSAPDKALIDAATAGSLDNATTRDAQIARLLDSPAGREHMGRFAGMWFRTDNVTSVPRTNTAFTQNVKDSMAQEIREIYKQVFYNNLPLTELYNGDFTVLNSTLSSYYGVAGGGVSATDWRVVNTQNSPRGGIVASGAYMALNAHDGYTSPIQRAAHSRRDVLCQIVPPPGPLSDPTGERARAQARADALLAGGTLSTTKFYDMQTNIAGTTCADCHRAMLNQMFGMDDFDDLGMARPRDPNGKVMQKAMGSDLRETGSLVLVDAVNNGTQLYGIKNAGPTDLGQINFEFDTNTPGISFNGAKGFSRALVSNKVDSITTCMISKTYRFTTGFALDQLYQDPTEVQLSKAKQQRASCLAGNLKTAVSGASGSPRAAVEYLGRTTASRFRR